MLRRAAVGGAVASSAAAGWVLGSVETARSELAREQGQLRDHPWVRSYKAAMRTQGFQDISEARRVAASRLQMLHRTHMFSSAVLSGPRRLDPDGPLTLKNFDTGEVVEIFHVGAELRQRQHFFSVCATMFDECLAATAFPWLPNRVGVTAALELAQPEPMPFPGPSDSEGGGLVVLRAKPLARKGRKCEAEAAMYVLGRRGAGLELARARALFIEPWWGKYVGRLV